VRWCGARSRDAAHARCRKPGHLNLESEDGMTDQENPERTAGGLVGAIAGRAKEAIGAVTGNDELTREGRLQQAQVDAQAEASRQAEAAQQRKAEADLESEKAETEIERQRLESEVAQHEREERIETDRAAAEMEAEVEAKRAALAAEIERQAREAAASSDEQRAESERIAAAQEAIRLEQEARQAERIAEVIDPKENQ
jgi:uncharacterized protein YjbJ (UPF0337 family)